MKTRKIDYLELCSFVSQKQAFALRWIDRYWRMYLLYKAKARLIGKQMDSLRGDDFWVPAHLESQYDALETDLHHVIEKRERCYNRHSTLIRYGQYFSQLPFRLLDNKPIPDCLWYVPQ